MHSTMTYSTYYPQELPTLLTKQTTTALQSITMQAPATTNLYGYNNPYSGSFSRGCNEPLLSPTIPQCQLSYGKILDAPIPISKKKFKNALISNTIGILIPPDQFVLPPLKGLKNVLIEITFQKYGLYSTGYKDVH